MIEIGTVTQHHADRGAVSVDFEHLGTSAECAVLQPTTGEHACFVLPSVGTQVVCWLESGKNIALGALFSDSEPVPSEATAEGYYQQVGNMIFQISDNKASLKNDSNDLKTILNDILTAIQNLTVSTAMGPSGTPLPPTVQAIQKAVQDLNQLLE
ncbi:hypothetical protein [uncultured Rikenella sp.]|uniref:hypothetical protein n=1 Tax=uncultured Rikenella sp. TaxID=368003 RepID=UPI00260D931C|nr:hypothetical protein [uncultured Rikenella sp.]